MVLAALDPLGLADPETAEPVAEEEALEAAADDDADARALDASALIEDFADSTDE